MRASEIFRRFFVFWFSVSQKISVSIQIISLWLKKLSRNNLVQIQFWLADIFTNKINYAIVERLSNKKGFKLTQIQGTIA